MVWVDGRCRVDLQAVVTFAGILEQTVHGVQHFVGQQEEPFSAVKENEMRDLHMVNSVYISKTYICNNYMAIYTVLLPC